jgi:hypothetical protein
MSTVFQPSRWVVQISTTSLATGRKVLVARHPCRDRHHAATLLSEIRELADGLTEFLPGLTAAGYELAEAALAVLSYAEAVADGTVNADEEAYWRTGLAENKPLDED